MRKFILASATLIGLMAPAIAAEWDYQFTDQELSTKAKEIKCNSLNILIEDGNTAGMMGVSRMAMGDWSWMRYKGEFGEKQAYLLAYLCGTHPDGTIHHVLEAIAMTQDQ